jgi:hypothetical protein
MLYTAVNTAMIKIGTFITPLMSRVLRNMIVPTAPNTHISPIMIRMWALPFLRLTATAEGCCNQHHGQLPYIS